MSASDVTPIPAAIVALTAHRDDELEDLLVRFRIARSPRSAESARPQARASRVLPVAIRNASSGESLDREIGQRGAEPDAGPDARSPEQHAVRAMPDGGQTAVA